MANRPLKLPGHRPLSRPEDRDRPFSGAAQRRDPRLGPLARCLSRGRRPGGGVQPHARALVDAVAAREASIRRLTRLAEAHAEARIDVGEARRELVDALLHCRALSLEVVEAFENWRAGGSRGGLMTDPQYLVRMKDDTRWLAESTLGEFLNFSSKSDPFFVVPSSKEPTAAPSNQMTPTLQAKRQSGDRRRAVLPLQASLLRRIRKAELLIMKESMQARLQQVQEAFSRDAARVEENLLSQPAKPPVLIESPSASTPSPTAKRSPGPSPSQAATILLPPEAGPPPRPKPTRPAEPPAGAIKLLPLGVDKSAVKNLFETYIERVPKALAQSTDLWKSLSKSVEDEGPQGLEWFWVQRTEVTAPPSPSTVAGLAVFRVKKISTPYGQLVHFTVVDQEHYEDALLATKALMFALLPIRSLRFTLWHSEAEDGTMKLNSEVEAILKKNYFRWFQLTNSMGVRGQVMQRPRGEPPDDPVQPLEVPSIEVCLGQVWLRGASQGGSSFQAVPCAGNLAVAASCLRGFWGKDSAEAPAPESLLDAQSTAAWAAAKEGICRALLNGELDRILETLRPQRLQVEDGSPGKGAKKASGAMTAATMAHSLAKTLEGSKSGALPEVLVQAVADVPQMVRRGLSQDALKEASSDLDVEGLPDAIAAMGAKDGCFGRFAISLDWQSVSLIDDSTFEVPVHAAGSCPRHPHPVFYLATTEDDIFVVIIPWHGLPSVPDRDEDVFADCTAILRDMVPMESSPFVTVQLFSLDARRAVRTSEITDAAALGISSETLHVAEWSSLSVSPGRVMPGQLKSGAADGKTFAVQRPFALCLWHADMDELNAPLSATMVS